MKWNRKLLRVEFLIIVLLEEALVEGVGPVVLELGPVQVILEVVAGGEPEADPERGVAGDDVANLPTSLDLDLSHDDFGPEFSEHLCRFLAGNLSPVLDPQQHFLSCLIEIIIRLFFFSDGRFIGACELDAVL